MNFKLVPLAAAALLLLAGNFVASATAGDKDKTPLEGTWKATQGNEEFTFTVTGAKWILKGVENGEEEFFSGTIKLDPKQSPKTMDLEVTDGSEKSQMYKGKTALAIYELNGDKLKWCANEPGREGRPTDFTKDDGDRRNLNLVFERQKK